MAHAPEEELRARLETIAEAFARERGWVWKHPVKVELQRAEERERTWSVRSNIFATGVNARVVIREVDLAVIDAGYLPR